MSLCDFQTQPENIEHAMDIKRVGLRQWKGLHTLHEKTIQLKNIEAEFDISIVIDNRVTS